MANKSDRPYSVHSHLDISTLESWLWEAACKIRGPVDAPKYKDYILPLIFLKRLSDVFSDEVAALGRGVRRPEDRPASWSRPTTAWCASTSRPSPAGRTSRSSPGRPGRSPHRRRAGRLPREPQAGRRDRRDRLQRHHRRPAHRQR